MALTYNKKDNEIVKVREYNTETEAYIAKAALDQAGIVCSIENALFSQLFPGNTALGGYMIVIKQRDYDRALEILDTLDFNKN